MNSSFCPRNILHQGNAHFVCGCKPLVGGRLEDSPGPDAAFQMSCICLALAPRPDLSLSGGGLVTSSSWYQSCQLRPGAQLPIRAAMQGGIFRHFSSLAGWLPSR